MPQVEVEKVSKITPAIAAKTKREDQGNTKKDQTKNNKLKLIIGLTKTLPSKYI
jgi:hypothetical protein